MVNVVPKMKRNEEELFGFSASNALGGEVGEELFAFGVIDCEEGGSEPKFCIDLLKDSGEGVYHIVFDV